jgi:GDSL-like lipase/acylhydrolase family protein
MSRPRIPILTIALAGMLVVACSGGSRVPVPSSSAVVTATALPSASGLAPLTYVAFGDSWPEGAHCGCRTFAGQWADALPALTGRPIDFIDLTGQKEPGFVGAETSQSLATSLTLNERTRDAVRKADIVLIATGPNDMDLIFDKLPGHACGGSDDSDCIRDLGKVWATNFATILTTIDDLRDGKPTVIRLVDASNAFLFDPSMRAGLEPEFATTRGAFIYQLLNDAMCDAAAQHHAACVDIRALLTGPNLDQAADENSAASMEAIARALLDSGVAELGGS